MSFHSGGVWDSGLYSQAQNKFFPYVSKHVFYTPLYKKKMKLTGYGRMKEFRYTQFFMSSLLAANMYSSSIRALIFPLLQWKPHRAVLLASMFTTVSLFLTQCPKHIAGAQCVYECECVCRGWK